MDFADEILIIMKEKEKREHPPDSKLENVDLNDEQEKTD
jgi:hypothetical protein